MLQVPGATAIFTSGGGGDVGGARRWIVSLARANPARSSSPSARNHRPAHALTVTRPPGPELSMLVSRPRPPAWRRFSRRPTTACGASPPAMSPPSWGLKNTDLPPASRAHRRHRFRTARHPPQCPLCLKQLEEGRPWSRTPMNAFPPAGNARPGPAPGGLPRRPAPVARHGGSPPAASAGPALRGIRCRERFDGRATAVNRPSACRPDPQA
jgi:hypothetical protein